MTTRKEIQTEVHPFPRGSGYKRGSDVTEGGIT